MLIIFYNFLISLFYIPFIFLILFRRFLKKEHQTKYKEKIFSKDFERPEGFLLWFHAASIGELKSILPLIDFYLKKNPNCNVLITTVTLSSFYEFERKYNSNKRVFHQFMPYDFKFLINNFLKNWQPDLISFVDSEIWPNFILKLKQKKIPLILLNARISKKSFLRWRVFQNSSEKIFNSFSLCISSNIETANYLKVLGAQNIKFFGNIKFCSSIRNDVSENSQFNKVLNKKIWCALSTHENEEVLAGTTHLKVRKTINNILTIIIPRHINRVKEIYSDLMDLGLKVQIKNEKDEINHSVDIVLVNYYGSVNKYLKNIDQVFIGKSILKKFENTGGQNPIDAAKFGCHIYHGLYVYNFQDVYKFLDVSGISEKVENIDALVEKLINNFNNNLKRDNDKINKINNFSNEIFQKVILEYSGYIK